LGLRYPAGSVLLRHERAPICSTGAQRRLARRGANHDGIDLAKYDIDAAGDTGHNSSRGHRHKPSHQRVLDKVLTPAIAPNPAVQGKPNYLEHVYTSAIEIHG
jgi:hypothetical protein